MGRMKNLAKIAKCQCGSDLIEIRSEVIASGRIDFCEVLMWLECAECRADCPSLTVGGFTLASNLYASWNDQQKENRKRTKANKAKGAT